MIEIHNYAEVNEKEIVQGSNEITKKEISSVPLSAIDTLKDNQTHTGLLDNPLVS